MRGKFTRRVATTSHPAGPTQMKPRAIIPVLLLLNIAVLVGQIWPEGAPPFARTVNIVFLAASLVYFVLALRGSGK